MKYRGNVSVRRYRDCFICKMEGLSQLEERGIVSERLCKLEDMRIVLRNNPFMPATFRRKKRIVGSA